MGRCFFRRDKNVFSPIYSNKCSKSQNALLQCVAVSSTSCDSAHGVAGLELHALCPAAALVFSRTPELLIQRAPQHGPPPPTVCQCLALITQPIVRLSRTLGPSTPRWRQLTPHNHQGQDNNLFVQDHLCLVLLCLCQQWLSFSFHALGCGLYVAVPSLYVAVFVISCPVPLHFLPRASTLEMKQIELDLIVRMNAFQYISNQTCI